jgi:RNA polymerase sigma-70 factor (ECF subfamily)
MAWEMMIECWPRPTNNRGLIVPLPFTGSLSDHPTDAELADGCKRGDLRAYERLYELHAARMKSLAFHMLGSRADAEDTVQEAFLKIYRAVRGFEGQSSLSTWIYRILMNCCYDAMRKHQRSAELPVKKEFSSDTKLPLKIALQRALDSLNQRQRTVFLMFEVEGLKHSEIAGILEVPEGTSRSWLFEAKRELKRQLMESGA